MIDATMMDLPLTLDVLHRRMRDVLGHVEIVTREADKSVTRTTFAKVAHRAEALARALIGAGIRRGDRVATLMWNHAQHLECYLGIPLAGAVLHTLNLRLHPNDICFIANDAKDRVLIIDASLYPLFQQFSAASPFEKVIVMGQDYETFIETAPQVKRPQLQENDPLGMCYTSGTTGQPKGVVYTHRSTLLHSLVSALPDALRFSREDTVLAVVPMFHANAWGLPYTSTLIGSKLVFPGPHLDPQSLLDLMRDERVTIAAGVPTIWLGIREAIDAEPTRWPLHENISMIVGGAAAPEQLIRDFDRQGMRLLHAWGMTELSPLGLVSRIPPELSTLGEDERYALRAKQGLPPPLVEVQVRNDQGRVPNDAKTSGELIVRAPWVASRYATKNDPARWTEDGFFRTGDVAHVDAHGFVKLTDRMADLIKSGGEWIASQELENALMGHPAVKEAAVIGLPHPKWGERPLAVVVFKPEMDASADELREHLRPMFAKYWLPDAFEVVKAIPRTSTGKFKKTELRETYTGYPWPPSSREVAGQR